MEKRSGIPALGIVLLAAALIIGAVWVNGPERRAARFVAENGPAFSTLAESGGPVPAEFGGKEVRTWSEEHLMYEFILGYGIGDRQYWGVYYSPDGVPLPFQNAGYPLTETGQGSWTWQEQGDNHGTTKKMTDQWYYFEAAF